MGESRNPRVAMIAALVLAPVLRARTKSIAPTSSVDAMVVRRPAASAASGPFPNIGASLAVSIGTTGP